MRCRGTQACTIAEMKKPSTSAHQTAQAMRTAFQRPSPSAEITREMVAGPESRPVFALQFDRAEIPALAERFGYGDDPRVVAAGAAAAARGHYTRGEFL